MMLMASTMTKEELAERLIEHSGNVLADPDDKKAFDHLSFYCHLVAMHHMTGGDLEKAMEVMKDFDRMDQVQQMMKTSKN